MKIKLVVNEERGEIYCTHKDFLMDVLKELGIIKIERASDVEFDNESKLWIAKFRGIPEGGELLSPTRDSLLKCEVETIDEHLLPSPLWRERIFETTSKQLSSQEAR